MSFPPPSPLFDLSGSVAFVTGGGRGIGSEIAKALAAHGARVAVAGRTPEPLRQVAAAITAAGGAAEPVIADVTDERSLDAAAHQVARVFGQPANLLVNNAGINPHYASAEKTSAEQWKDILDVNLQGVVACCRVFGPPMLAAGSGAVINISSIGGHVGLKRQTPYCTSKGAIEQYTRALAADWADRHVRVNSVAYGYIETELTVQVRNHPVLGPRLLSRIPMARFGRLTEVGGAVVFLASPGAAYVTGHSLLVDGGWTAT